MQGGLILVSNSCFLFSPLFNPHRRMFSSLTLRVERREGAGERNISVTNTNVRETQS